MSGGSAEARRQALPALTSGQNHTIHETQNKPSGPGATSNGALRHSQPSFAPKDVPVSPEDQDAAEQQIPT